MSLETTLKTVFVGSETDMLGREFHMEGPTTENVKFVSSEERSWRWNGPRSSVYTLNTSQRTSKNRHIGHSLRLPL